MDYLPPEAVLRVCDYLPWRDRLSARALFSKFCIFSKNSIQLERCRLKQTDEDFTFGISVEPKKEQKIIEIIRDAEGIGYDISKAKIIENEIPVDKMTIICSRKEYPRLVRVYLNFFASSIFSFNRLRVVDLNGDYLAYLRAILTDRNYEVQNHRISVYTANYELTEEEKKFLNYCTDAKTLKFCPPDGFHILNDFPTLPFITDSKNLVLQFGGPAKEIDILDMDFEIDNEFISRLIENRVTRFQCNAETSVTLNFIQKYIEDCLRGGHTLFYLDIGHRLSEPQLDIIQNFLTNCGFEKEPHDEFHTYHRQVPGKKRTEGYDPDRLIVELFEDSIEVTGDFACYRDKTSIDIDSRAFYTDNEDESDKEEDEDEEEAGRRRRRHNRNNDDDLDRRNLIFTGMMLMFAIAIAFVVAYVEKKLKERKL